ncbi:hypothetical protein J4217_02115 [Candidatus Pacearchaeota archaeon]|nr:hypothetical protein [Candidatus Pacearchaeota archaeon]
MMVIDRDEVNRIDIVDVLNKSLEGTTDEVVYSDSREDYTWPDLVRQAKENRTTLGKLICADVGLTLCFSKVGYKQNLSPSYVRKDIIGRLREIDRIRELDLD